MTSPGQNKKLLKPDSAESRKQNEENKTTHGDTVNLKVLIPSNVGKALHGKRGHGLKKLESDHQSKIEMSKNDDYYPGTGDRVCLISGRIAAVRDTHDCFVDVMAEKEDKFADDKSERGKASARITVKILVPNSTVSMIIGKRGEYIRSIKDTTSVYIQASQKSDDRSLLERCITISGERDNVKKAVAMVLEKISADSESGIYPHVSYADVKTAIPSTRPTGSPYASGGGETACIEYGNSDTNAYLHTHNIASSPLLNQLKAELRAQGYNDKATCDIVAAMYTLVGYKLLQLNLLDKQTADSNNAQTVNWYSRQMGGGMMMTIGPNNAKIGPNGWVVWPNGEEGRCGWMGGPEVAQPMCDGGYMGYQAGWSAGWNIQEQRTANPESTYQVSETSTGASKRSMMTQHTELESTKRACKDGDVQYGYESKDRRQTRVDDGSRSKSSYRMSGSETACDMNQQPVYQSQICNSYNQAAASQNSQPLWSYPTATGQQLWGGDGRSGHVNNYTAAMPANSEYSMQQNSWSQYWQPPTGH